MEWDLQGRLLVHAPDRFDKEPLLLLHRPSPVKAQREMKIESSGEDGLYSEASGTAQPRGYNRERFDLLHSFQGVNLREDTLHLLLIH